MSDRHDERDPRQRDDAFTGLLADLSHEEEVRAPQSRRQAREQEQHAHRAAPRRRGRGLAILLVVLLALGGLGAGVVVLLNGPFHSLLALGEPTEYTGDGTGSATVVIAQGDYGDDVAKALADAGVVKSSTSFYQYLLSLSTQPTFQPGTYALKQQMSNKAALAALLDSANKSTRSVTIPEGYTVSQIFDKLAGIGFSKDELTALDASPSQFGLPSTATSLEGFLFPATYDFDPATTAAQAIQTMVDRTRQSLTNLGVADADVLKTIILASIVQKEAGANLSDMAKIARVFLNRLDADMLLQSDATVAYGAGSQGTVWTTAAQRADSSNAYNTYVHKGLPPGAISNPGDDALDAALNPASGSWLFFTVVNLKTGETVFSNTADEHNAAVAQLTAWCAQSDENAKYCS